MKIVALMQNMWLRDPVKAQRQIDRDTTGKLRERMIAYALFAGCLSGRRLRECLGTELCDRIIWEEASPVIADNPRDYHSPDPEHIKRVIAKHQPDVVICFTKAGWSVVREICREIPVCAIEAIHPAARGPRTVPHLQFIADLIRDLEAQQNEHPTTRR